MNISWFIIKRPKTYKSSLNGMITVGTDTKNKGIFSGGVTQSGKEIAIMWNEVVKNLYTSHPKFISRSHKMLKQAMPDLPAGRQGGRQVQHEKKRNILILGVGGGSVIHAIRQFDKAANITGIELDPVMKQIAIEQFGIVEDKKQKIIIADAISWVKKQSRISRLVYRLIVVDLYIGPLNPKKARMKAFLEQIKTLLKPEGIILYNAHFQKKNPGEYESFQKLTNKLFKKTEAVFSYPLNRVLQISGWS